MIETKETRDNKKNLQKQDVRPIANDAQIDPEEEKRKKEEEYRKLNEEIRKEAQKTRRPSATRMADEICLLSKKAVDQDEPEVAKYARAVLTVFLRELSTRGAGRHVDLARLLLVELKERRPLGLRHDIALVLANAAVRYEIGFGRVLRR